MNFTQLIKVKIPEYCGVHPSYGDIAMLVFKAEQAGDEAFSAEAFEVTRERAKMVVPFADESILSHREAVDLVEYGICSHRQKNHGEDHDARIAQLAVDIGETPALLEGETLEAGTRRWWSN